MVHLNPPFKRWFVASLCLFCTVACSLANCVWASDIQEKPFHVRFEALKTRAGMTLGYVDAILQDSQGYIWLGGENGLARYDGYEFTWFRNQQGTPHSLSDNTVWALAEDSHGDVWVATEGGVNRYNHELDTFTRFQHNENNTNSLAHDTVHALIVTRAGLVVIGTFGGGISILNPSTGSFEHLQHQDGNLHSLSGNAIWSLFEDDSGGLWIGTEGAGVTYYHPQSRLFRHYQIDQQDDYRIGHNTVRAITQDKRGNVWLGTDSGVVKLGPNGKVVQRWGGTSASRKKQGQKNNGDLGEHIVWDIYEGSRGDIWIATDGGGLYLIHHRSGLIEQFLHEGKDPFSISSNVVRQVMEDAAGDIWTANFPSGANVFHRAAERVAHYRHEPGNLQGLNHSSVLSFLEGEDGDLWVGTDGGGVNRISAIGKFEYISQKTKSSGLNSNAILSLAKDQRGNIWLGTWGGGVTRYNPKTKSYKHYPALPDQASALSHPNVWAILVDSDGDIWFGTEGGGLNRYSYSSDKFDRMLYGQVDEHHVAGNIVWSLYEDNAGFIWIGSNAGLSRLDKARGTYKHYQRESGNPTSLSNNTVLSIFQDSKDRLWVGTRAGLNRLEDNGIGFGVIRVEDGLANDAITSILQDDTGMLWLGSNDGVIRLDPDLLSIRNYNQTSWAKGKFNYGSALKLKSGELVIGGVNGFIRFLPEDIKDNEYIPPVVLTDFQIFNKSAVIGARNSPLKKSIASTQHVTLNYKQSVFSFEFCGLNFYGSDNNHYAYKLEGFDRDWNHVGSERKATYTNLEPGEYQFYVKASNNEDLWNEQGASVRVTIAPPPWRTWWAYLIYILIIALIVWSYVRAQQRKIIQERLVSKKLRQLDRLKDDFLANTSHELRTPLNGIIGLSESMIEGAAGDVSELVKYNLSMIVSSGKRLADLVNDILDFSLLKRDQVQVEPKLLHLRDVVDTVVVMSRPLAGKKELDISNAVDKELPTVMADENRLQQILYNILGNAIKYTDSGSVTVSAEWTENAVWVHVKDSGVGIAQDKLETIFESFEQVESHEDRKLGGTGLGLAVTKRLVELHGGEIKATSKLTEGSEFSFSLPYSEQPVTSDSDKKEELSRLFYTSDYDWSAAEKSLTDDSALARKRKSEELELKDNDRFKILIVDDEPVNQQVLMNQLSRQNYRLVSVSSGREALLEVKNNGPFDLILLDVMMPRMSGYEVCSRIRKNHAANDLPVIFLTAKNLISDLVDGFDVGANDFLTKPIAAGELVPRVRTHLQLLDIHRHFEDKVRQRTETIENSNKVLETLDAIVATINQEVIFDRLLDVLLREAIQFFPVADRAVYWSFDAQKNVFEASASQGLSPSGVDNISIHKDTFLTRYCVEGKRLSNDVYLLTPSLTTSEAEALAVIPSARSVLALAIRFDDSIVGFLCLASISSVHAFDAFNIKIINRFFIHIKSALLKARLMETLKNQNERLEDRNLTDPLTSLRNQRYLLKYLESDIALTLRSHRRLAQNNTVAENSDLLFFLLDIDYFKEFNNQYGDASGDRVLTQMKAVMETVFRESDFLVRWGGEKFLMVARFCNRQAGPEMAERLREAVAQHRFVLDNNTHVSITCSLGFASFPYIPRDPLAFGWTQVVDIMDMCLGSAKKSQRDCWVGLEAKAEHGDQLSFQEIAARPQQLIDDGRLCLHTSIAADKPIKW